MTIVDPAEALPIRLKEISVLTITSGSTKVAVYNSFHSARRVVVSGLVPVVNVESLQYRSLLGPSDVIQRSLLAQWPTGILAANRQWLP